MRWMRVADTLAHRRLEVGMLLTHVNVNRDFYSYFIVVSS